MYYLAVVRCGFPLVPRHGYVIFTATTVGSTFKIYCDKDYYLNKPILPISCLATGQWTQYDVTCIGQTTSGFCISAPSIHLAITSVILSCVVCDVLQWIMDITKCLYIIITIIIWVLSISFY